jgi:hypothetical protein
VGRDDTVALEGSPKALRIAKELDQPCLAFGE